MPKRNKFFISIVALLLAMGVITLYFPLLFAPSSQPANRPSQEESTPPPVTAVTSSQSTSSDEKNPSAKISSSSKPITSSPGLATTTSPSSTSSSDFSDLQKEAQGLEDLNKLLNP